MATVANPTPSSPKSSIGRNHRRWRYRKRGTSSFKTGGTAPYIHELQPAMDLPSSRRSNREGRTRSVLTARPSRGRSLIFLMPSRRLSSTTFVGSFDIGEGNIFHVPGDL